MEVFSSALITYSSAPSGSPSRARVYRSRTRAALSRKPGSLMKIQDRCCQGLMASWTSRRRTGGGDCVDDGAGDDLAGQLRGRPAGQWRAALRWQWTGRRLDLGCNGAKEAGPPERVRSDRAGSRFPAKRSRQVRTVSTCSPVSRATRALERPRAAYKTTWARRRSGALSCGRRPSSSAAHARRRSGRSGMRRCDATRGSRSREVDGDRVQRSAPFLRRAALHRLCGQSVPISAVRAAVRISSESGVPLVARDRTSAPSMVHSRVMPSWSLAARKSENSPTPWV